jgi:hypothetical protein
MSELLEQLNEFNPERCNCINADCDSCESRFTCFTTDWCKTVISMRELKKRVETNKEDANDS